MSKLFVYGIFLDEFNRNHYGMSNPVYDTVKGFVTKGSHIVQAVRSDDDDVALTGLTVDMNDDNWLSLDALEGGYDRIKVKTTKGHTVFMYARKDKRNGRTYQTRTDLFRAYY